jgi:hypothetical protein
VRDEIDLLYKTSHEKRIISILKGEISVTGEKPIPKDPYPRPQHCDTNILTKGSKFVKKMMKDAGWT